jgi:hypothetical protein
MLVINILGNTAAKQVSETGQWVFGSGRTARVYGYCIIFPFIFSRKAGR